MTFEAMQAHYRDRMNQIRETFNQQGYLFARSQRDPGYTILLKPGTTEDAAWNVYSFRDGQPVGHRDYDRLEGGSAVQNAFAEFVGDAMQLEPLPKPAKGIEWAAHLIRSIAVFLIMTATAQAFPATVVGIHDGVSNPQKISRLHP